MSVVVEDLRKRFAAGDRAAVDGVSFTAPSGSVTSLLGPSGSGKTTVLRLIAGLEKPDAGRVLFSDEEMTRVPVQKRGVGFVFQGYALFAHMTVRKNIAFGLRVQRVPSKEIEPRVEELLQLVQLGEYGDRYPEQLSGGQRQRVAFARALATKPKVLLLDEPFGALDARVRVELRAWLRELHEKIPVTTLLVTHDQEEALEISDRVVLLDGGKIHQVGTPDEIYDHPATPFVASFIGNAHKVSAQAGDGRNGVAYVRPHDVRIARAAEGLRDAAVVTAIQRVGGEIRVEVQLFSNERMTVRLSRADAEALALCEGDRVTVDLGKPKVFVGDYSI